MVFHFCSASPLIKALQAIHTDFALTTDGTASGPRWGSLFCSRKHWHSHKGRGGRTQNLCLRRRPLYHPEWLITRHLPFSSPCCVLSYQWLGALASGLQMARWARGCPRLLERIPHPGWQIELSHWPSSQRASNQVQKFKKNNNNKKLRHSLHTSKKSSKLKKQHDCKTLSN